MSLIAKRDINLLLDAGFSLEDLGLNDGGVQGVEIYESPDDYFAKELIENACEEGILDLMDEPSISEEEWTRVKYDTTRKGLYADQVYDGSEDYYADVPAHLRDQAEFLKSIKIGKMTIWQRRNKKGQYEWQVKGLHVTIPEEDRERANLMTPEHKRELWLNYARDEWKKVWEFAVDSLKNHAIEEKMEFKTHRGYPLKLLAISADAVREEGYRNLPAEARWITLVYFDKDIKR